MGNIEKLSRAFSRMLKDEIGYHEFLEMVGVHKQNTDPQICVSHDYCDPNMVMLQAFEKVFGRLPDIRGVETLDTAAMGEAWNKAKENNFYS